MSRAAELRELVIDAMSWSETFDGGRVGAGLAADLLDRYLAARDDETYTTVCRGCRADAIARTEETA